jgi:hypothetical protein
MGDGAETIVTRWELALADDNGGAGEKEQRRRLRPPIR